MAELATVARPYAEAVFRSALEQNAMVPVADSLALVAAIARDEQMHSVLLNPKVAAAQKKEVFNAAAGERLHDSVKRLVSMLVDNHRAALIGSIGEQFEQLKHEHERVLRARITSAQALTDAQRSEIVSALEKCYGKKIEAGLDVDPELLGGARVQIGDQVIHASVRDALADRKSVV